MTTTVTRTRELELRRFQIREGDALTKLAELEAGSIQTCVTSPPYFGLRDYGTAKWRGGDHGCDHSTPRSRGDDIRLSDKQGTSAGSRPNTQRECGCGAVRVDGQLGLEKTPEAYVAALVGVFQGVRRVLRNDATVWLNLGDSYAATTRGTGGSNPQVGGGKTTILEGQNYGARRFVLGAGLKPKDLIGIPWMVAFALRADGWYLRSDIIWHKPNPMPESVEDRPTKSHEYIFLLSKSAQYFYDAEAILEQAAWAYWGEQTIKKEQQGTVKWMTGRGQSEREENGTRNKRSVWTVATHSFPDAHFATFPPKLIEPCILAGSKDGDTVLDPFAGAGTTGLVALRHNRHFIGIELNPSYCEMARRRVLNDAPLFNEQVA